MQALGKLQFMPGLTELCTFLDAANIPRCLLVVRRLCVPVRWCATPQQHAPAICHPVWPTRSSRALQCHPACPAAAKCLECRGLITRNALKSVEHFHAKLEAQPFRPALNRAFLPYKPDPSAILHICQEWGLSPAHVAMVGDSAKDDVRSLR